MKPTPEQIKQMAIECGAYSITLFSTTTHYALTPKQLQAFFTRAYELGWKNRGESDVVACQNEHVGKSVDDEADNEPDYAYNMALRHAIGAIRKNTGE